VANTAINQNVYQLVN